MPKITRVGGGGRSKAGDVPVFWKESTSEGINRLVVELLESDAAFVRGLARLLDGPFHILYVLHTPRGEGAPGRYYSTALGKEEIVDFLRRFECFLSSDARQDVWVRAGTAGEMLVWDRHNRVYLYGEVDLMSSRLKQMGLLESAPLSLGVHVHHYREEFDEEAASLLRALRWSHAALRPEDRQFDVDEPQGHGDGKSME